MRDKVSDKCEKSTDPFCDKHNHEYFYQKNTVSTKPSLLTTKEQEKANPIKRTACKQIYPASPKISIRSQQFES